MLYIYLSYVQLVCWNQQFVATWAWESNRPHVLFKEKIIINNDPCVRICVLPILCTSWNHRYFNNLPQYLMVDQRVIEFGNHVSWHKHSIYDQRKILIGCVLILCTVKWSLLIHIDAQWTVDVEPHSTHW